MCVGGCGGGGGGGEVVVVVLNKHFLEYTIFRDW